ncbi:hypothetical protein HDU80_002179, partial [Chytriomyces hyalinus]
MNSGFRAFRRAATHSPKSFFAKGPAPTPFASFAGPSASFSSSIFASIASSATASLSTTPLIRTGAFSHRTSLNLLGNVISFSMDDG